MFQRKSLDNIFFLKPLGTKWGNIRQKSTKIIYKTVQDNYVFLYWFWKYTHVLKLRVSGKRFETSPQLYM